jgi:hypothetical protein
VQHGRDKSVVHRTKNVTHRDRERSRSCNSGIITKPEEAKNLKMLRRTNFHITRYGPTLPNRGSGSTTACEGVPNKMAMMDKPSPEQTMCEKYESLELHVMRINDC